VIIVDSLSWIGIIKADPDLDKATGKIYYGAPWGPSRVKGPVLTMRESGKCNIKVLSDVKTIGNPSTGFSMPGELYCLIGGGVTDWRCMSRAGKISRIDWERFPWLYS
jgi:hypothetical protein